MRDSRNCHERFPRLYIFIRGRGWWHTGAANPVLRGGISYMICRSPIVLSLLGRGTVSAIRAWPVGTPATPAIKFIFTTVIVDHPLFKGVVHFRAWISRGRSRPRRGLIGHRRVHLFNRNRGHIYRLLSVGDKRFGRFTWVGCRLLEHFLGRLQCIFATDVWFMIATTLVFLFVILAPALHAEHRCQANSQQQEAGASSN